MYVKYTEPGKLIIKPNPSSEKVVIEFNYDVANHYQLTVIDNIGNTVYTKDNISESTIELNIKGWGSGTYFINLSENSDEAFQEKLIIIK